MRLKTEDCQTQQLYIPIMKSYEVKQLKIESSRTKLPLACVAISAFEICRPGLELWVDIPAAATLVCDHRKPQDLGNLFNKGGIVADGVEPVSDGQVGALEVAQDLGKVMVGLLRKDQVCQDRSRGRI